MTNLRLRAKILFLVAVTMLLLIAANAFSQSPTPFSINNSPLPPPTGFVNDYAGVIDDPARVATFLSFTPGLVDHGLFPPSMVADVFIARGEDVEHRSLR